MRQFAVTVAFAVQFVHDFQMLSDVAYPTVAKAYRPQPARKAGDRREPDECEPEPDEDVDLLVEEIDRQDALDGVRQAGAHRSDLEVAQSHSREARRRGVHSLPDDQVVDDFDAVQVIAGSEEEIQQKQLHGDVAEVQDLDRHVQSQQVVAEPIAARQAEVARHKVFEACAAAASVFALVVQVVIEMSNHVLDGLITALRVQRVLDGVGRLD